MSRWYLYSITNQATSKQYIGITSNPGKRHCEHFSGRGSKLVKQAIEKYGRANFSWQLLCCGSESYIKELEVIAIRSLQTLAPYGYNLTVGGEGATGCEPSANTRQKMSLAHLGERNGMSGKRHSTETRNKIRCKAQGRPPLPHVLAILRNTAGDLNPRARRVVIGGVIYGSIANAALATGKRPGSLRVAFSRYQRSGMWPDGMGYVTDNQSPE